MNNQAILIFLLIIIIIIIIIMSIGYTNNTNCDNNINNWQNNSFKRIRPNHLYDNLTKKEINQLHRNQKKEKNQLHRNQKKEKNQLHRNQKNGKNQLHRNQKNTFSVNCYNDNACKKQPNGTGCRTIFYTDGICLNENCIPTNDYDAYRMAIINGKDVSKIEEYANTYQKFESNFVPQVCSKYVG